MRMVHKYAKSHVVVQLEYISRVFKWILEILRGGLIEFSVRGWFSFSFPSRTWGWRSWRTYKNQHTKDIGLRGSLNLWFSERPHVGLSQQNLSHMFIYQSQLVAIHPCARCLFRLQLGVEIGSASQDDVANTVSSRQIQQWLVRSTLRHIGALKETKQFDSRGKAGVFCNLKVVASWTFRVGSWGYGGRRWLNVERPANCWVLCLVSSIELNQDELQWLGLKAVQLMPSPKTAGQGSPVWVLLNMLKTLLKAICVLFFGSWDDELHLENGHVQGSVCRRNGPATVE